MAIAVMSQYERTLINDGHMCRRRRGFRVVARFRRTRGFCWRVHSRHNGILRAARTPRLLGRGRFLWTLLASGWRRAGLASVLQRLLGMDRLRVVLGQ